jgi:hypothetical protein
LNENELTVYNFIDRMENKTLMKKKAANYFKKTFQYFIKKKEYLKKIKNRNLNIKEIRTMKKDLLLAAAEKLKGKKDFSQNLQ